MLWSKAIGAGGTGGGGGWNLTDAVYDGVSFSLSTQDTVPNGLFFRPDGTMMFIAGNNTDRIYRYVLSTPWDLSTALASGSFSTAAQENNPAAVFFKPDGLVMYVTGGGSDRVWQYNSTSDAWNMPFWGVQTSIYVGSQEPVPTGLFFKPDGTKMYMCGWLNDRVHEYNLSTPWNVSTAVFFQNVSVGANSPTADGIFFKPDGTAMYVVSDGSDSIGEYALGSPWDVSSATYVQRFSVAGQDTFIKGVSFKPDGTKMYVIGDATNKLYQYSTA